MVDVLPTAERVVGPVDVAEGKHQQLVRLRCPADVRDRQPGSVRPGGVLLLLDRDVIVVVPVDRLGPAPIDAPDESLFQRQVEETAEGPDLAITQFVESVDAIPQVVIGSVLGPRDVVKPTRSEVELSAPAAELTFVATEPEPPPAIDVRCAGPAREGTRPTCRQVMDDRERASPAGKTSPNQSTVLALPRRDG
jgi:hypothetical protein